MSESSDTGLLVQELVYAGLEALRAVVRLDLCAYLHASGDRGPQLFLATPDLSAIEPTQAFNLFSALRDAMDSDAQGESALSFGSYRAIAVPSTGAHSRGLHVAGRLDTGLAPEEQDTIARLARALGGVAHALEASIASTPAPVAPIRVAVEMLGGKARAEVSIPLGPEIRTGAAEASSPSRAVANAVLDAVDASLKLVDTADGEISGERAVLVLVTDTLGRTSLGSALIGEGTDALQAVAAAALDATRPR